MTVGRTKLIPSLTIATSSLLLVACSNGPSVPVLGAYFPDWLFCIVGGVLFSLLFHALVNRYGASQWWGPSAITQFLLTTIVALSAWLLFFHV
ncbi:YtcA family lipoprotein [Pseudomonas sp. Pseu.R1]|uniref:YtcA family lipoprotein n=1 Tax=Pseudomonas sp. Pseu.R1 TaxID=3379818 RepID=UPI003B9669F4